MREDRRFVRDFQPHEYKWDLKCSINGDSECLCLWWLARDQLDARRRVFSQWKDMRFESSAERARNPSTLGSVASRLTPATGKALPASALARTRSSCVLWLLTPSGRRTFRRSWTGSSPLRKASRLA